MQTVREIQYRATHDLRQRIFHNGIFRQQHMKDMARSLARKYTAGMSPEKLLALDRHDTWLKGGHGGNPYSQYPGEKTNRIAEKLLFYLRSELGVLVDSFWEGRTSVEFAVQCSSVDLVGFFKGKRPGRRGTIEGRHDDAHSRQHAPYV